MGATRRILVFKNLSPTDILFSSLVTLLTLPYHRFFTYNTLRPAQEIQKHAQQGGVDDRFSPERQHLYSILVAWRSRKRDEINFAVVAATVITAIVTASFSWGNVADSLWVGPAFWYASLSTSICGIFLGAQQLSVLSLLGELPALEEDVEEEEEKDGGRRKKKKKKQASSSKVSGRTMRRHLAQILYEVPARQSVSSAGGEELGEKDRTSTVVEAVGGGAAHMQRTATTTSSPSTAATDWKISWRSIFTWQCPMMFIAYSTLFYIVGLSVVVLTPLIKEDWGENSYVAVAYAASTGLAWGLFAFCSLGGYSEISMHQREEEEEKEEEEEEQRREREERLADPDDKKAGHFGVYRSRTGTTTGGSDAACGDDITRAEM